MAIASRRLFGGTLALLAALSADLVCAQQVIPQPPAPATRPAAQEPHVTQPTGPYRGLFGAGSAAQPGGHLFDLTLDVYEEYAEELDGQSSADTLLQSTGWFTGVHGALAFEKAGRRVRVGLRTEGAFRYYSDTGDRTLPRYRGEFAIDTETGRRRATTLHFGGAIEHEPYYVLPVFGGGAPVTGGTAIVPTRRDDLLFQASRNVFTQTFVLEHPISARSFLGVSEELRYTLADSAGYDVQTVRAGGYYGYQFSPYGSLRLGYAYRGGRFGPETSQRLQTHDIDVGFDYRRPLPRMRRTTFGFSTGSSLVTSDPHQRWEFVGTVNLRHEFDRGWFLQGDFSRNTRLVEGFGDPFFENTVSASLGGFLSRRVELLTSGGYSRGEVGFTSDRYTVVQGSARLRLAIGRYLAANAEGLVYRYDFDDNVARPDQMLQSQHRWSVRCNLTVWLPLSR